MNQTRTARCIVGNQMGKKIRTDMVDFGMSFIPSLDRARESIRTAH